MSCKICGKGSCASWMHSSEEVKRYEEIESMSEREMIQEIISLRSENESLRSDNESLRIDLSLSLDKLGD